MKKDKYTWAYAHSERGREELRGALFGLSVVVLGILAMLLNALE